MPFFCGCFEGLGKKGGAAREDADCKRPLLHPCSTPALSEGPRSKRGDSPQTNGSDATEEPPPSARSLEVFGREASDDQETSIRGDAQDSFRKGGFKHGELDPLAIVGTWRYHETATYDVNRHTEDQWRFYECHDSGREVIGLLQQHGQWIKGDLSFTDTAEECGTIRMRLEDGIIRSNFRPSGADWWSGDMVATRETDSRLSSQAPASSEMDDADIHSSRGGRSRPNSRGSSRPNSQTPSRRGASNRSSTRERSEKCEKHGLELIPTRVRAKLERSAAASSLKKQRRGTPLDKGPKQRPSAKALQLEAGCREALAGSARMPSAWQAARYGADPRQVAAEMPIGATAGSGRLHEVGPAQEDLRPCCPTLFHDCCRNGSNGEREPLELAT